MRRLMIIGVIALGAALFALPATAHNAGHIHLPNGTCVDVGSGNPGPVPQVDKYKENPTSSRRAINTVRAMPPTRGRRRSGLGTATSRARTITVGQRGGRRACRPPRTHGAR